MFPVTRLTFYIETDWVTPPWRHRRASLRLQSTSASISHLSSRGIVDAFKKKIQKMAQVFFSTDNLTVKRYRKQMKVDLGGGGEGGQGGEGSACRPHSCLSKYKTPETERRARKEKWTPMTPFVIKTWLSFQRHRRSMLTAVNNRWGYAHRPSSSSSSPYWQNCCPESLKSSE